MKHHERRRYVLCYDIADPKRLRGVHRRVRRSGIALQRSVFDCELNTRSLQELIRDIRQIIDARHDDVRIYGPRHDAPVAWFGAGAENDGVQFFRQGKPATSQRVPAVPRTQMRSTD